MNPTTTPDPVFYILLFISVVLLIAIAFFMGIYHERKAWNSLIDDGRLPRPNESLLAYTNRVNRTPVPDYFDNTTQLASTAFVHNAVKSDSKDIDDPCFCGRVNNAKCECHKQSPDHTIYS